MLLLRGRRDRWGGCPVNYFPFHIGDYLSATRHLSWVEDGAFRRLLDVYYTTEKALPLELKQVWRLVLATTEDQREAVETVLVEFFEKTEAGWVNRRADAEIDAMRDKQQKQRDKANKRWHKPAAEPGIASAMPRHADGDAAASEIDADAMPPTPTPTPTPDKEKPSASSADKLPPCQPQAVIDLYHEALPELPGVRLMTDKRRKAIGGFWRWVLTSKKTDGSRRAQTADQALTWIRSYFERATDNDFLMGRGRRADGHENWQCDLDFLLTEKGMKHVIEKTKEAA
jgi:uncharacterized protein YdaU (DUF1376 family)